MWFYPSKSEQCISVLSWLSLSLIPMLCDGFSSPVVQQMLNFSPQPRATVPTDQLETNQEVAHSLKRRLRQSVSFSQSVFNSCQYSCGAALLVLASEKKKQQQNSALLSLCSLLLHGHTWAMRRDFVFFFLFRVTWCDPEAFLDDHRPTHRLSPLSGVTGQPVFSCRTLAWVKRQTVDGRRRVRSVALIFEQLVGAN